MKSCLLLIFSLMTGIKASEEVTVCAQGWIQFTCKYPKKNTAYDLVRLSIPKGQPLKIVKTNVWININRFSLYHDTLNKRLRVIIKPIERNDDGGYKCTFVSQSQEECEKEIELDDDIKICKGPDKYTAAITDTATITCDSETRKPNIFCKDINCASEDILSTRSSRNSNGRFEFLPFEPRRARGFSVSIRNVSAQDAGFYWCGFESKDRTYRVSLKKIWLDVKMPPPTPSIIPSTSTATSSTSSITPATVMTQGGSWLTAVTAAVICVAVLVLVVILVFVSKRFQFHGSNDSTDGKALNKEAVYEDIQESSLKTVYTTATFPTNPAAFMDDSTVNFQNRPGEVTGDVYSTVLDSSQSPSYSTINHPPGVSKDPFYSTVNFH